MPLPSLPRFAFPGQFAFHPLPSPAMIRVPWTDWWEAERTARSGRRFAVPSMIVTLISNHYSVAPISENQLVSIYIVRLLRAVISKYQIEFLANCENESAFFFCCNNTYGELK